jgi:VanZ family protein
MRARQNTGLKAWLPPSLWALFILLLGGLPSPPQPEFARFELSDKLAHAFLFGIFAVLVHRALGQSSRLSAQARVLAAIGITMLYGAADEVRQLYVPNRHGDVWDWVADTIGAMTAVGGMVWASKRKCRPARTSKAPAP